MDKSVICASFQHSGVEKPDLPFLIYIRDSKKQYHGKKKNDIQSGSYLQESDFAFMLTSLYGEIEKPKEKQIIDFFHSETNRWETAIVEKVDDITDEDNKKFKLQIKLTTPKSILIKGVDWPSSLVDYCGVHIHDYDCPSNSIKREMKHFFKRSNFYFTSDDLGKIG